MTSIFAARLVVQVVEDLAGIADDDPTPRLSIFILLYFRRLPSCWIPPAIVTRSRRVLFHRQHTITYT